MTPGILKHPDHHQSQRDYQISKDLTGIPGLEVRQYNAQITVLPQSNSRQQGKRNKDKQQQGAWDHEPSRSNQETPVCACKLL
ncbi:MAG: hypothetical protein PsegKO_23700 [Pseudohongiellaceae bacterium]